VRNETELVQLVLKCTTFPHCLCVYNKGYKLLNFHFLYLTFWFEAYILHREVALEEDLELCLDMIFHQASSVDIIPHCIYGTLQLLSVLHL
jgi:hypothetical protein